MAIDTRNQPATGAQDQPAPPSRGVCAAVCARIAGAVVALIGMIGFSRSDV